MLDRPVLPGVLVSVVIHHAIVATFEMYQKDIAREIFDRMVAEGCKDLVLIAQPLNGRTTLFMPPSGSNAGWPEEEEHERLRGLLIAGFEVLRDEEGCSPVAWVEVQYGNENDTEQYISRQHQRAPWSFEDGES